MKPFFRNEENSVYSSLGNSGAHLFLPEVLDVILQLIQSLYVTELKQNLVTKSYMMGVNSCAKRRFNFFSIHIVQNLERKKNNFFLYEELFENNERFMKLELVNCQCELLLNKKLWAVYIDYTALKSLG